MKFTEQSIKGVWVIEPRVFTDERGYFMESFKKEDFEKHIGKVDFVQDNESKSTRGVLRGLHYQTGEYAQAKLVRALKGSVLDVIVDLRRSSPTFGQSLSIELTEDNKKQFFVPRGFAHGFLVLSPEAIFSYKVDNVYAPQHEASLLWSDPTINIDWGISEDELILSAKDKAGKIFSETAIFE
ncbi:dTDP-4-dehydrorhamnose 3,5-epimerase [Dysgonomonas sp. PFB1-18]|uniref:dTDP-4-dehydrorhamnose 3,5-epimerase n=1 Tax=unclassified Dysgonomonas TaxID=2630389 RepID=UPI002477195A|nr:MULTISPECIES: dTDP-4-dehydrorhamnose 3,5-epimerase [unclassified Dysgonomonas]MDH6307579.1 dTDP-4-dehydrorhamnose 3,5-epimerase [Dysgonomonas sp. PF1-14]MDH6337497.1 dTDP-4-dehydrorhamnose 3,5-epimerase [Dysgonomonas sp. PF1-16]MDH6378722.1 dTDP-4-dehydrorhamnose 3,5-epimerase [Dysgonomonas sp. PFB1-18]MDH6399140.1 dTDP-4-dehydrorhamnose 3,5-epimerase [Dysgonomonas sp. PF1-23]